MESTKSKNGLQLISPAFRDNARIPVQYTCKGQNVNPPLNIFGVPSQAKSLTLIMHDPDAPGGDYLHWLVWDIAADTETITTNTLPPGAVQGRTGFGDNKYGGPCPPAGTGTHHYIFELYALDTALGLDPGSSREKLQEAMKAHTLDQAKLTGLFGTD
jgi:Raf kinase inhibitor-like YbhB/YbcL family protein